MAHRGVGDVSAWWGLFQSSSDVYVYRFVATNVPEQDGRPKNPLDLLDFASAVGRAQSRNLDIRAVTVWKHNGAGAGQFTIDVVATSVYTLPTTTWNEPNIDEVIKNDASVGVHFPGLGVSGGGWYQITSPAGTIDFWRSRPVLWDHSLSTTKGGHGGPSAAFGASPPYAVAYGRSDDAVSALRSLVPSSPPVGPDGGPPPASQPKVAAVSGSEILLAVAIVGIIVWAVRTPGSRKFEDEEFE